MLLAKENDNRYLKIRSFESEAMQTITKTEIDLFNEIL